MLSKRSKKALCVAAGLVFVYILWNVIVDNSCDCSRTFTKRVAARNVPKQMQGSIPNDGQNTVPGEQQNSGTGPVQQDSSIELDGTDDKKGYHIHINLDQLQMYVYKDGNLINTYPVSGGKPATPTPVGTWRIIHKDTWGEGFGGAWMGLNVPWGTYGIHGTLEPWLVGKSPASKGCIRMRTKDAQALYKMIPHGTTVIITHDNRPFRTIASGDVGSDVMEVQNALKKLGYYDADIDGVFGDGLKQGVENFQRDNKFRSTGVVNKQIYDLILQKYRDAI